MNEIVEYFFSDNAKASLISAYSYEVIKNTFAKFDYELVCGVMHRGERRDGLTKPTHFHFVVRSGKNLGSSGQREKRILLNDYFD